MQLNDALYAFQLHTETCPNLPGSLLSIQHLKHTGENSLLRRLATSGLSNLLMHSCSLTGLKIEVH